MFAQLCPCAPLAIIASDTFVSGMQGNDRDDHDTCAVTEDNLAERLGKVASTIVCVLYCSWCVPTASQSGLQIPFIICILAAN